MSILSQQKQSVNIDLPNIRPSLDLRFALAKKLDPRVTFSRGTSGTYYGPDGLIKTSIVNEPRFDHDPITGQSLGLLIEELSQNYELNSGDPTQWASNQNMTLTGNSIVLPNGTTSTNVEFRGTDSGANVKMLRPSPSGSAVAIGETWTFSIFLRAGTEQTVHITMQTQTGADNIGRNFNLVTGQWTNVLGGTNAANGTSGYQYVGNGWYRVWLTNTYQSSSSGQQTFVRLRANTTQMQMTTSFSAWGAQLEKKPFPTSYIPTTSSTVSRSADDVFMDGTNFSSWYNSSEWTLMISAKRNYSGSFVGYPNLARINDGIGTNNIGFYGALGSDQFTNYGVISNNANYTDYTFRSIPDTKEFKMIQSLQRNRSVFGVNGVLTTSDISVEMPISPNRLLIGGDGKWGGTISRLMYYPVALNQSQLINLTS